MSSVARVAAKSTAISVTRVKEAHQTRVENRKKHCQSAARHRVHVHAESEYPLPRWLLVAPSWIVYKGDQLKDGNEVAWVKQVDCLRGFFVMLKREKTNRTVFDEIL